MNSQPPRGAGPRSPASGVPPRQRRELKLDLLLLETPSADPKPVVVWIHGDQDSRVPISQSVLLNSSLGVAGVTSEFIVVENAGHGDEVFGALPYADKAVNFAVTVTSGD